MYPTDLTEAQRAVLAPYAVKPPPAARSKGRPPEQGFRAGINGMLYALKTGCRWRMLPKGFPPWKTVYGYLRRWRLEGARDSAVRALREAARQKAGRKAEPPVATIGSRPVKRAGKGGGAVSARARRPRGASNTSR
ncbi:MAG: transposase [Betaproteobacteria bacterium]|nr:transposase [Betaproteobacteria bacterium]